VNCDVPAASAAGQRVSEWNASTHAQLKGHYYWGGKPVAFYTAGTGGAAHFQHQDWVGTERLRTTYNGGVEGSFTSLPFGDGLATVSGSDTDANHYATLDHDSESDTEHAEFRQYSSSQGHWLAPDPYDGSYDPSNPQSMNRYAYALNNPLSYIDPLGLNLCDYGPSDNGGEDFGDADDDSECTTNDGTPVTVTDTVTVSADGSSTGSEVISGAGWSVTIPYVPTTSVPTKQNIFTCASAFANKISIAGGLHALGVPTSGVGGFVTDALGGNAFSGATDLIQSVATGQSGTGEDSHSVFYNLAQGVAAGPTQGFGAASTIAGQSLEGTPWGSGPADVATGTLVGAAVNTVGGAGETVQTLNGAASLASAGVDFAEDFASGVGVVKLIYDAGSYGWGLVKCY